MKSKRADNTNDSHVQLTVCELSIHCECVITRTRATEITRVWWHTTRTEQNRNERWRAVRATTTLTTRSRPVFLSLYWRIVHHICMRKIQLDLVIIYICSTIHTAENRSLRFPDFSSSHLLLRFFLAVHIVLVHTYTYMHAHHTTTPPTEIILNTTERKKINQHRASMRARSKKKSIIFFFEKETHTTLTIKKYNQIIV